jgi:hypothetical protein
VFLCVGLLAHIVAAAGDDWKKDQDQIQQQLAGLPQAAPASVKDVVQFSIEQNELAVRTRLQPTDGNSQIKVSDLPGLCSIEVRGPTGKRGNPRQLSFIRYRFTRYDKNNEIESVTTVMTTPLSLQVARDVESTTEIRNISIVQNGLAAQSGDPGITLRVSIQIFASDQPALNIARSATDFASLRRLYPADVAKYLGPIFQDLHADADVFAVDSKLAWQIMAADAPPQANVATDVQRIIARLDSDDFHERESAAHDLAQLGQPAANILRHLDRTGLSAEQNSRIDAFLSQYHPAGDEEAQRLGNDPEFLIDCLYSTDDFIVQSSLGRLTKIIGSKVDFDPSLRGDARRDAIRKLHELVERQTNSTSPSTAPN